MRGRDNNMPSEANRYDGAPAPDRNVGISIGDAKAAAEEARENASCDHCDEDDYEDLKKVAKHHQHDCSAHQHAPPEPLLLCSDCREEHTPEEDFIERLREADDVRVLYECGIARSAEQPDVPDDAPKNHPSVDTRGRIPATCRCGAHIEEIFY